MSSHKVGLAAIRASVGDDNDDGVFEDVDDNDNASRNASDDEMSSVNSAEYISSELAAQHALPCNGDMQSNADVAAIHVPHALDAYGYMPQFFGVARFAENDSFRTQCLMDPGGAINIISPMLANRSAVERICSNDAIFTGKRKTGSVVP